MLTGVGEQGLRTPAAPLVLLQCKASSTTTEIGVQGIDTDVFATMGSFRTEVHGWEEEGVFDKGCISQRSHTNLGGVL